jgi:hypothetical protein
VRDVFSFLNTLFIFKTLFMFTVLGFVPLSEERLR